MKVCMEVFAMSIWLLVSFLFRHKNKSAKFSDASFKIGWVMWLYIDCKTKLHLCVYNNRLFCDFCFILSTLFICLHTIPTRFSPLSAPQRFYCHKHASFVISFRPEIKWQLQHTKYHSLWCKIVDISFKKHKKKNENSPKYMFNRAPFLHRWGAIDELKKISFLTFISRWKFFTMLIN